MIAYRALIMNAIAAGYTVSVWDDGEWQVSKSTAINTICDAVKSVEEATLRIYDGEKCIGTAYVSAYGLEDDETIIDHTDNEIMNKLVPQDPQD